MKKRERWRRGFRLTKGDALVVWNAWKAAEAAGDRDYSRRLRSIWLVGRKGYTQGSAAEILEVTTSCVWRWVRTYRLGGVEGLRPRKAPGAKPRLSKKQLERLQRWVQRGPEACGFDTGVWTGPLVRDFIKRKFGVNYSVVQVRRILHKLGFSVQYPKKILSEASQEEQERWLKKEYPRIKKRPNGRWSSPVRGRMHFSARWNCLPNLGAGR